MSPAAKDRIGAIVALVILTAAIVMGWVKIVGCVPMRKDAAPIPIPSSQPADDVFVSDQQGGVNAAVQGNTGISLQSAVGPTLAVLVGWIVWLSHRRERLRLLKGNGCHETQRQV